MNNKNNNWSKRRVNNSVNPQGYTEEDSEADMRPKSQLEQRAKKKNTKI